MTAYDNADSAATFRRGALRDEFLNQTLCLSLDHDRRSDWQDGYEPCSPKLDRLAIKRLTYKVGGDLRMQSQGRRKIASFDVRHF
jgi:hypothetical protein